MNKTDLKENGSRWRRLAGQSPTEVFTHYWGAKEVYPVPDSAGPLRSDGVFMLKMEDGWRYAHADHNSSCYCAGENLGELPNGDCAWKLHELVNAQEAVLCRDRELELARQRMMTAQKAYEQALECAHSKKEAA